MKRVLKLIFLTLLCGSLIACATTQPTAGEISRLQQGKRLFEKRRYKESLKELMPLACIGMPEAQYAVGYMYFYGYGVAQDTDLGYFWIKRAADKHYRPAENALALICEQGKFPQVSRQAVI